MNFDVFNGDADGIISLLQLRLDNPLEAKLITGVKRDIQLLQQVKAAKGDNVTVLDISMEKNISALEALLADDVMVFYADHHRSGEIPNSDKLNAHIDLDANTCTALIIDESLEGRYHAWAITAAYGDNLIAKADELARIAGYNEQESALLKELGTLVNYNGYGASISDLHYGPADLFTELLKYPSPFDVFEDKQSPFYVLKTAYEQDIAQATSVEANYSGNLLTVISLPNTQWSKRVSGVFGNLLANESPDKAHAVLTENIDGTFMVSLRAPLRNKQGAGYICSQFETGGGREAAGGINKLPSNMLLKFCHSVERYYSF